MLPHGVREDTEDAPPVSDKPELWFRPDLIGCLGTNTSLSAIPITGSIGRRAFNR